jgi:hypothetical protein
MQQHPQRNPSYLKPTHVSSTYKTENHTKHVAEFFNATTQSSILLLPQNHLSSISTPTYPEAHYHILISKNRNSLILFQSYATSYTSYYSVFHV